MVNKTVALILASGISNRFSGSLPKQYIKINQKTVLRWSIEKFLTNKKIDDVLVVINKEHINLYRESVKGINIMEPVIGGGTRQESVYNGIKNLQKINPKNVLIHDAARPNVSTYIIDNVIDELDKSNAVDVVMPVNDSLKKNNTILNRSNIYISQTPQGFDFQTILNVHQKHICDNYSDDIGLCISEGISYKTVNGSIKNIKITYDEDIDLLRGIMGKVHKIGIGVDNHRFSKELPQYVNIKVCGIDIPHKREIVSHSDGDVGFHAITDSLLGAMAIGNIGQIFPNTDNNYKNMDSKYFLMYALNKLSENGGQIVNIDLTIVCDRPLLMGYSVKMRQKLSEILNTDITSLSVKATSTEGLSFIGSTEGIAGYAVSNILI